MARNPTLIQDAHNDGMALFRASSATRVGLAAFGRERPQTPGQPRPLHGLVCDHAQQAKLLGHLHPTG